MKKNDKTLDKLINKICNSYKHDQNNEMDSSKMPSKDAIIKIIGQLQKVLFPGYFAEPGLNDSNIKYYIGDLLNEVMFSLIHEVDKAFIAAKETPKSIKYCSSLSEKFLNSLPKIRELLKKDVEAALYGDPAAKSIPEIIISYPYVKVITVYRIAHEMHLLKIPLIPRMMTEYVHSLTGVDIHPGALIGEYFFIDHGTGVVIGETAVIGNNVKIYQGVTLGALSFPKDKKGRIIKGLKRHPTIQDDVTIYANATILGGKTTIGKGATIGGNSWIMKSVNPGEKIINI